MRSNATASIHDTFVVVQDRPAGVVMPFALTLPDALRANVHMALLSTLFSTSPLLALHKRDEMCRQDQSCTMIQQPFVTIANGASTTKTLSPMDTT